MSNQALKANSSRQESTGLNRSDWVAVATLVFSTFTVAYAYMGVTNDYPFTFLLGILPIASLIALVGPTETSTGNTGGSFGRTCGRTWVSSSRW